jgi:MFS family permease
LNKKIFVTLFFAQFATITGVGIVVPLLPVYASDMGASGLYIGMIFGVFSLSRTFLLPYFGRLSDRKGRRPLILIGLSAYALVSVAFIFASNVSHLIFIRFLQGFASAMIMPVIQAYVGDITPANKEGFTMGLINMSLFFGLSAGPVAGGLINDHFNLQTTFVCMGILALMGLSLCFWLLPSTRTEKLMRKDRPPLRWRAIIGDRVIVGLFAIRLANMACTGIIWGFLPVLAATELGLKSSQIGILVMLGVLVNGTIQLPMGYLADRFSRKTMIIGGVALAALAVLSFQWATNYTYLVIANVLFGLGGGIAMPAVMATSVLKGNQTNAMGSVMALLTMGHSMGMFVGALLAGLMMDWFQMRDAFGLGAAMMVLGIAVFALCALREPIDSRR